jgi:hypothetical protein
LQKKARGKKRVASSEKRPLQLLHALHVAHSGDLAHAGDDALQVLEVGDFGNQVNRGSSEFLNPLG